MKEEMQTKFNTIDQIEENARREKRQLQQDKKELENYMKNMQSKVLLLLCLIYYN